VTSVLVTGSTGHLGEALIRVLRARRASPLSGSTSSSRPTPTASARSPTASPGAGPSPHVPLLPGPDDRDEIRGACDDDNVKVNELLYRRVDLADVVDRTCRRCAARPTSASAVTS
jgi:nucleoside-diphosphate-sugar epimerase